MIFEQFTVGVFQCNCFILGCETTREALVIDPGDELPNILGHLERLGLTVTLIAATHAHLDHVGAMGPLHAATGAPTCLHPDDQFLYDRLAVQAALFSLPTPPGGPVIRYVKEGDRLTWGSHEAQVIHTPGHTPGSICFSMPSEGVLFAGDTLFRGSVGRTDLWGGSHPTLIRSIRERLLTLPGHTRVLPGHGPATRIDLEGAMNPFLTGRY